MSSHRGLSCSAVAGYDGIQQPLVLLYILKGATCVSKLKDPKLAPGPLVHNPNEPFYKIDEDEVVSRVGERSVKGEIRQLAILSFVL